MGHTRKDVLDVESEQQVDHRIDQHHDQAVEKGEIVVWLRSLIDIRPLNTFGHPLESRYVITTEAKGHRR